jgi:hypothetical protein
MMSFRIVLEEISDTLDGGDIVEDFDDNPYAVGIIRSIMAIVSNELRNIGDSEELIRQLRESGFTQEE